MMKYVYARENMKRLTLLALIVGLPLIMLSIFFFIADEAGLAIIGYSFLITAAIFWVILLAFSLNAIKWRKWHKRLESTGVRTTGKVIDFGYRYHSGNLHHDPPTPSSEEFWLVVQYVDQSGVERILNTPVLSFSPEERNDITCDVYICDKEILATNFRNLNKKKTDWTEVFFYILIGVILFGIFFIIEWFKNIFF